MQGGLGMTLRPVASVAVREQRPQLRMLEVLVTAALIQGVEEPTVRLDFSGPLSRKEIGVFQSSSLKMLPKTPNPSHAVRTRAPLS